MTILKDTYQYADEQFAEVAVVSTPRKRASAKSPAAVKALSPRVLEGKNDVELIELAKGGEKRAFDVLVLRHQQMVISMLLRMMDHSDAWDVAQEAFIKAYRSIGAFRGDSQFTTWLYRIATNTAMNHLKLRRRRSWGVQMDSSDSENGVWGEEAVDRNSPEDFVIAEELQGLLQRRFERMKPDLREAILCYEIEGMSYQDIADRMDCPVGTIRSRISRSREILNKDLSKHGFDPLSQEFARDRESLATT